MTGVTTRTSFLVPSEIFCEEPKRFDDEYARRCFRVLRMVGVLHGKGYHGLRVFPYKHPLAYRIELFPSRFVKLNGVSFDSELFEEKLDREGLIARHSGANESKFFGWDDATHDTAHQLAIKFVKRYPSLALASYHLDYAYAGWFATLLAHCEYGYLPYLFDEYEEELDVLRIWRVGSQRTFHQMDWFPLPPSQSGGNQMDPRPAPEWLKQK